MKDFKYWRDYKLKDEDLPVYDFITENYDELKSRICIDEFGEKIFSHLIDFAMVDLCSVEEYIRKFARCYIIYSTLTDKEDKYVAYTDLEIPALMLKEYIGDTSIEMLEESDITYIVYDEYKAYLAYKYNLGDCTTTWDKVHAKEDKEKIDLSIFTKDFLFDEEKLDKLLDKMHKEVMPGV